MRQAEIAKLLDELRARAKAAMAAKDFKSSQSLYQKAIELSATDATLHSNLSLAQLSMGQSEEALAAAETSIRLDPTFSKGFYRKGQALLKLGRHEQAAVAFDLGGALEPENMTFKDLAEKSRKQAADDALRKANEPPPLAQPALKMPVQVPKGMSAPVSKHKPETKAESSMRGYKITADGKKTTFFNHDLVLPTCV